MARSLRAQLLGWVLGPLTMLAAFNATASWIGARNAADLVTDRTLLASARSIAEQARLEEGAIEVTVPPAALEMFDNGAGDFVYYAATGSDGALLAGVSGLPAGVHKPGRTEGEAFEADFRERRLRLLSVRQPLTGPGLLASVTVVVGVTLKNRDAMTRRLWIVGFGQQLALIAAAGLLMAFGLKRGLAPLVRLRDAVTGRSDESLEPLDADAVQAELRPLVTAINRQMERVRRQLGAQHRFVTNAAHQLRTPLAVLNLQATYALRQPGTESVRETLEAIQTSTGQLSRLSGQLLTLSRAEPGSRRPRRAIVPLGRLAARVLDGFAEAALARDIDLGLDERRDVAVRGDETLLGEMLANLVDNALRYCPPGSVVTVTTDRREDAALLSVRDDGGGVPAGELEHLFERFHRVAGTAQSGSGLGLAIVREVAVAAGGSVAARLEPGGGLAIEVLLPEAAREARPLAARPMAARPPTARSMAAQDEDTAES